MAWTPEHKQQSRTRILQSAAELFALHGFERISINDVMQAAGMTRGAFYNHFHSKAELYAEAILTAARAGRKRLGEENAPDLQQVIQDYLSLEHRQGAQIRCPLAFLVSDISQRDDQARDAYTKVFRGWVALLQQQTASGDYQQALQQAVMMIGGVAVARALNNDALADELLEACRQAAREKATA